MTPFYKQVLSYRHGKHDLRFQVSQDLFSSACIDHGTQRVLRSLLLEKIETYRKALDMGCGYGPIGIALKAVCPSAEVHMTDRDALAVAFSRVNASQNGFNDLKIYGSLAFDDVQDADFDLIVSNIPAKVGESTLRNMIIDVQDFLVEGGKVVIVVIDAINDFVYKELTKDTTINITFHRSWPGHHVYHYQFMTKRAALKIDISDKDLTHDLPEFDQLSYDSSLLLQYLGHLKIEHNAQVLCLNPGRGHIPLAVAKNTPSASLMLPDRDLLALRTTSHALSKVGIDHEILHQIGYSLGETKFDMAIGSFPDKHNKEVYELYVQQIIRRDRDRGRSVIEMRKK